MDLQYCIRSQTYDGVELNFTRREMKCKMIQIKDLTKIYPRQLVKALDQVSIEVEDGEFFGLLGPNGAGKTTLIKVIATLLLPSSGEVLVDGELLGRNRVDIKSKIAIMTQEFSLRQDMNVFEIMEMQGRLYRVPMREIKRRTDELLEFCGLDSHRDKQCRKLSGGMKRRLMLCRALLTHPDILVLDEPTVGTRPDITQTDVGCFEVPQRERNDRGDDHTLHRRSAAFVWKGGPFEQGENSQSGFSSEADRRAWRHCGGHLRQEHL